MSLMRNIEVIAQGKTVDEACKNAVSEASKTLRGIKSFYVKNIHCTVEGDQITSFSVNGKVNMMLEDDR